MEELKRVTVDDLYINPFSARREYEPDGRIRWIPLERNLQPTGVPLLDRLARLLAGGATGYDQLAREMGTKETDMRAFIRVLTGMDARQFRLAYMFRLSDDLLRYTKLKTADIARRVGASTSANLCQLFRDNRHMTPSSRRRQLRQPRDLGLFRL